MSDPLNLILCRLELDPPRLDDDELQTFPRQQVETLKRLGILRPTSPSTSIDCIECGAGHSCRIEYLTASGTGVRHAYIHCPECGIVEIARQRADRWSIDVDNLLQATFGQLVTPGSLAEVMTGQLWRIGRIRLAGYARDAYFARYFRQRDGQSIHSEITRRPKAILFVPTDTVARRLSEACVNPIVTLEESLEWNGSSLRLDAEYVKSRFTVDGDPTREGVKRQPRKRAARAAKIELLENELIEHLRAARDHAFVTKDRTNAPEWLPRPTQREMGRRCGLSESDVSRCLKDETASYLRLLWSAALDLDQIMSWKTPTGNRRLAV